MNRSLVRGAGIVGLFAMLTVAMTWPQARQLRTHVSPADDPLLSIWRVSWIAHALDTMPSQWINGNIFHPEQRTLAYTDATLLQGLLATPALWAGASPVAVYNVLLLGSIALSGAAMWLLARRFTDSRLAAIVAGIIFSFVPFRFDHYMHLELQAAFFLPLALWWLDRAVESGSWRDLAGFAASVLLQTLSSIYYAVFLVTALVVALPFYLPGLSSPRRKSLAFRLAVVTAVAGVLVLPYLSIYLHNRAVVGERPLSEVQNYSATLTQYLATPMENRAHGWWSYPLGLNERRLFPGVIAVALAAVGLADRSRRRWFIVAIGVVGLVLSMGMNTPIYNLLREGIFAYRGLRVPARAAILVYLALSVLAAWGWSRVVTRLRGSQAIATAIVALLLLGEYFNRPPLWPILTIPGVARVLAHEPRSVVVGFPLSTPDRLDVSRDSVYMYESTFHWQPMLNGYSGFYPRSYFELLERERTFPDDASINYLKERNVDFIVVHGRFMAPDKFGDVIGRLVVRPDLTVVAEFREEGGSDMLFRLRRSDPSASGRARELTAR